MTLKLRLTGFSLNLGDPGSKREAVAEILRLSVVNGTVHEEACLSNTFAFVIIKAVD